MYSVWEIHPCFKYRAHGETVTYNEAFLLTNALMGKRWVLNSELTDNADDEGRGGRSGDSFENGDSRSEAGSEDSYPSRNSDVSINPRDGPVGVHCSTSTVGLSAMLHVRRDENSFNLNATIRVYHPQTETIMGASSSPEKHVAYLRPGVYQHFRTNLKDLWPKGSWCVEPVRENLFSGDGTSLKYEQMIHLRHQASGRYLCVQPEGLVAKSADIVCVAKLIQGPPDETCRFAIQAMESHLAMEPIVVSQGSLRGYLKGFCYGRPLYLSPIASCLKTPGGSEDKLGARFVSTVDVGGMVMIEIASQTSPEFVYQCGMVVAWREYLFGASRYVPELVAMDQKNAEAHHAEHHDDHNRKKNFMTTARLKPLFAETIKSCQGQKTPAIENSIITPGEWMAKTGQLGSSDKLDANSSDPNHLPIPGRRGSAEGRFNRLDSDADSIISATSSGPSIIAASQMMSHRTGDDSDSDDSVLFDLRDEETRRIREVCFTRVSELFKDLADFLTVTKRHEYVILRKGAADQGQVFENNIIKMLDFYF